MAQYDGADAAAHPYVTTTRVCLHLADTPVILEPNTPVLPADLGSFFSSLLESGAIRVVDPPKSVSPKKKDTP